VAINGAKRKVKSAKIRKGKTAKVESSQQRTSAPFVFAISRNLQRRTGHKIGYRKEKFDGEISFRVLSLNLTEICKQHLFQAVRWKQRNHSTAFREDDEFGGNGCKHFIRQKSFWVSILCDLRQWTRHRELCTGDIHVL